MTARKFLPLGLSVGLTAALLLLLALGATPGKKVDPRLIYRLIAGIATLHACYLCLIAHVILLLRRE